VVGEVALELAGRDYQIRRQFHFTQEIGVLEGHVELVTQGITSSSARGGPPQLRQSCPTVSDKNRLPFTFNPFDAGSLPQREAVGGRPPPNKPAALGPTDNNLSPRLPPVATSAQGYVRGREESCAGFATLTTPMPHAVHQPA
jgi:hypothetical protein